MASDPGGGAPPPRSPYSHVDPLFRVPRRAQRVAPGPLRVTLEPGGVGTLVNLSELGALVEVAASAKPKTEVMLLVDCHAQVLRLPARVVRSTPHFAAGGRLEWVEATTHRVALEFNIKTRSDTPLRSLIQGSSPTSSTRLAYRIDPQRRLATIEGEYGSAEEWRALLIRMLKDPAWASGLAALRDVRHASTKVTVQEVVASMQVINELWGSVRLSRAAILTDDWETPALAAHVLAESSGLPMRMFTDEAQALAWLRDGFD